MSLIIRSHFQSMSYNQCYQKEVSIWVANGPRMIFQIFISITLIIDSHPRNWLILVKLIFHRCSFNIFFSICHANSENVIKNSVSAGTLEPPANSGSLFCQNLIEFLACAVCTTVSSARQDPSGYRIFNYISRICIINGERNAK